MLGRCGSCGLLVCGQCLRPNDDTSSCVPCITDSGAIGNKIGGKVSLVPEGISSQLRSAWILALTADVRQLGKLHKSNFHALLGTRRVPLRSVHTVLY